MCRPAWCEDDHGVRCERVCASPSNPAPTRVIRTCLRPAIMACAGFSRCSWLLTRTPAICNAARSSLNLRRTRGLLPAPRRKHGWRHAVCRQVARLLRLRRKGHSVDGDARGQQDQGNDHGATRRVVAEPALCLAALQVTTRGRNRGGRKNKRRSTRAAYRSGPTANATRSSPPMISPGHACSYGISPSLPG